MPKFKCVLMLFEILADKVKNAVLKFTKAKIGGQIVCLNANIILCW